MVKKIIFALILCMLMFPLVSAATNVVFTGDTGLRLETISPNPVAVGTTVNVTVHVFNQTNGILLDNSDVSCEGLLTDRNGIIIVKQSGRTFDDHFFFTLNDTMATEVGSYYYVFHCNTSSQGGFFKNFFDVTTKGDYLDVPKVQFYIGTMFILVFLFVVSLFGFNALPDQDPKDLDGKLMDINWLKYLRYPVGVMAWGCLTMIFFLGWNISESYFITSLTAKIFELLFKLNFYALMISIPILLWYIVVKAIEDKKFQRMITRGIM